MKDMRYAQLAHKLVNYSCRLQPGEKLLLETVGTEEALSKEIIRAVYAAGGQPFISIQNERLQKEWLGGTCGGEGISVEALSAQARWDAARMADMDAYIGLRIKDNLYDMAGPSGEINTRHSRHYLKPVHFDLRVPGTKWVILRYPTPSMAQEATMSTEDFEDFYFEVCNFDYGRMSRAMEPLLALLQEADMVEIKGPGISLGFSVKNIGAVKCDGQCNIPDGEIYTAPVKESVEGRIRFNTPSPYQGKVYRDVELYFKKGRITEATAANHNRELQAIFDTDEGARYIGEFAFGLHPAILSPMKDILFDEKISGSFHLTPGNCYDEADNGNKSSIHWDLVCILRKDFGGGEIYVDGQLIQKDGLFVPDALQGLNPENMRG
ncbi:MAG: aminopeptidase [Clostridiales bacterium]|nr:aminopeptidase [Clostridiales bacterium]